MRRSLQRHLRPQNSKIRNQYDLELPSGELSVVFPICHRINVDRSWTNSNLQRSLYIPNNGNSPKLTVRLREPVAGMESGICDVQFSTLICWSLITVLPRNFMDTR